jgi:hypothetical protein
MKCRDFLLFRAYSYAALISLFFSRNLRGGLVNFNKILINNGVLLRYSDVPLLSFPFGRGESYVFAACAQGAAGIFVRSASI